jgi:hypothetical protein
VKNAITIRMGAANYDATVWHEGKPLRFDLRTMERKEKNNFHRELMNAVRNILPARKAA